MIETVSQLTTSIMRHRMIIALSTLMATGLTALFLWMHPRPAEGNMILDDSLYTLVFDESRPVGPLQHLYLARSPMLATRVTARLRQAGLITGRFPTFETIFRASRVGSTTGPVRIYACHESAPAVLAVLNLWAEEYRACAVRYRARALFLAQDQMVRDETLSLALYEATTLRFREKRTEGGGIGEEAARQLTVREIEAQIRQCRLDVLNKIGEQLGALSRGDPGQPTASPGLLSDAERNVRTQLQDRIADLLAPPILLHSADVPRGLLVAVGLGVFMLACAGAAGFDRRRGGE
ncbi:MAG: hypothetical protein WCS01_03175 [bacterium]